jgi:hypothetical protein
MNNVGNAFLVECLDKWLAGRTVDPLVDERDSVRWYDSGELGTVGYDFQVGNGRFESGVSIEALKWLVAPNYLALDRMWIGSFRTSERAWRALSDLRLFRDRAGIEDALNHVEGFLLSEGVLETSRDRPWLFANQDLPDVFRTLAERGYSMVVPSSRASVLSGIPGIPVVGFDAQTPMYTFEQRRNPDGSVSVFASKYWGNGSQHREIAVFRNVTEGDWKSNKREFDPFAGGDAAWLNSSTLVGELEDTRSRMGLDVAMTFAENTATANGFCDPNRTDTRLFSEGPSDPFLSAMQKRVAQSGREGDKTLRFEFRRGRKRDKDGSSKPTVEAVKYWESDAYSVVQEVSVRNTEQDADALVESLTEMMNDPLYGARAAMERALAIARAERRGKWLGGNSLWRVGPELSVLAEIGVSDGNHDRLAQADGEEVEWEL